MYLTLAPSAVVGDPTAAQGAYIGKAIIVHSPQEDRCGGLSYKLSGAPARPAGHQQVHLVAPAVRQDHVRPILSSGV